MISNQLTKQPLSLKPTIAQEPLLEEAARRRFESKQLRTQRAGTRVYRSAARCRSRILRMQSELLIEQNRQLVKENRILNLEFHFALRAECLPGRRIG